MANRYSQPAFSNTQIQSSFVPMPLDFMQNVLDRKQQTFDQRESEIAATKDHWSKMQALSADEDIKSQYTQKYDDYIKENLDKVGGDYGNLSSTVSQNMMSDMQTGQVAAMTSNFNTAQATLQAAKKKFDANEMSKEAYNRTLDSIEGFGGTIPDGNGGYTKAEFYVGGAKVDIEEIAIKSAKDNGDKYDTNGNKYKSHLELADTTLKTLMANPDVQQQVDDMLWAKSKGDGYDWNAFPPEVKLAAKQEYLKDAAYRAADRYDYYQHKELESSKSSNDLTDYAHRALLSYTQVQKAGRGFDKRSVQVSPFASLLGGKILTNFSRGRKGKSSTAMGVESNGGIEETPEVTSRQTQILKESLNDPYIQTIAKALPGIQEHLDIINSSDDYKVVAEAAKKVDAMVTETLGNAEAPIYDYSLSNDPYFKQTALDRAQSGSFPQTVLEGIGLDKHGEGLDPTLKTAVQQFREGKDTNGILLDIKADGMIPGTNSSYPNGSTVTTATLDLSTKVGRKYAKKIGLPDGESQIHIITMPGEYSQNSDTYMRSSLKAVNNSKNGMVVKYSIGHDGKAEKQLWVAEGYMKQETSRDGTGYIPLITRFAERGGKMVRLQEPDGKPLQGIPVHTLPERFKVTPKQTRKAVEIKEAQSTYLD